MTFSKQITCRIFTIPLEHTGRRWAFQVQSVPESVTEAAGQTSLSELATKIQGKEKFNDRLQLLSAWGTAKAKAQWADLEGAPPKSLKKRLANLGNYLLSKIHPAENFLKSIPPEFTTLHVVHPADVHSTLVRRRIRLIAKRGPNIHRWWTYASISALPVTFLLPSPVFFYNLFRVHANWSSWKGGSRLLAHLEQSSAILRTSSQIKAKELKGLSHPEKEKGNAGQTSMPVLRFESSKELSSKIIASKEKKRKAGDKVPSKQIIDEQLEIICKRHGLDLPSILRWRNISVQA
ncbi:hypothetical protein KFL_000970140 [Klebsormidium nitens]|uniref:Uncharacterized protein n=1 Tax=Klebsormidium nitens TaxID=105231 RepID=A0A0U9HJ95_KLENI|nr:hypothetical protein KFL_000970140 [Klebsormidium nitens]|eukprot:GAQ81989.1 hypothetical protein KFL_000970140 [Klebsormidium nitens]